MVFLFLGYVLSCDQHSTRRLRLAKFANCLVLLYMLGTYELLVRKSYQTVYLTGYKNLNSEDYTNFNTLTKCKNYWSLHFYHNARDQAPYPRYLRGSQVDSPPYLPVEQVHHQQRQCPCHRGSALYAGDGVHASSCSASV